LTEDLVIYSAKLLQTPVSIHRQEFLLLLSVQKYGEEVIGYGMWIKLLRFI
jgi:hypothetical protein